MRSSITALNGESSHGGPLWTKGALNVCLLNGSPALRSRVAIVAWQWTLYASLRFDFGDGNEPRSCVKGGQRSDVRVTFKGMGDSAYIVTDGLQGGALDPTVSPESVTDESCQTDPGQCDHAILHEFGHVLGFDHAWTAPAGDCKDEMNWAFIYKDAATTYGWSRQQIREMLQPRTSQAYSAGAFDRRSVMNYELPATWFKKGKESKCFLVPLNDLSLRDKLAAYKYYP